MEAAASSERLVETAWRRKPEQLCLNSDRYGIVRLFCLLWGTGFLPLG